MMRIALILPDLGPSGTRRSLLTLAKGLCIKGCLVDLVVSDGKGVFRDQIPDGVNLVDFQLGKVTHSSLTRKLVTIIPLIQYLKAYRPDVVYPVFDYFEIIIASAARLVSFPLKKPPTVVYGIHSDITFLGDFDPFKRFLLILLKKSILRAADAIFAVSKGTADSWARYFGIADRRIKVIYNPVDIENIQKLANYESCSHYFDSFKIPVIMSMGRLSKEKDFSTLIRAFSIVIEKREARLIILGDGKERPKLQKLVDELHLDRFVSMPGFIQNPFPYLKRATVFVVSSLYEGFSNALVEAMALGVPIVSTDCPYGPREILDNGKFGTLVQPGDYKALAEAILFMLTHPTSPDDLISRANYFSINKSIDNFFELLKGANLRG